jgi:hypothetical protein
MCGGKRMPSVPLHPPMPSLTNGDTPLANKVLLRRWPMPLINGRRGTFPLTNASISPMTLKSHRELRRNGVLLKSAKTEIYIKCLMLL